MLVLNLIVGAIKNHPFFAKQITNRDEIGRLIELICSLENIKNICEIGTFNGRGSSQQIVKGIKKRKSKSGFRVVGVEAQLRFFQLSRKVLPKYFELHFGIISEIDRVDSSTLNAEQTSWYKKEIKILESSNKLNLSILPDKIDLLILDGGEFSTYGDFINLYQRVSKFVLFDDTSAHKCKRILSSNILQDNFIEIYSSDERNGIALYMKKQKREDIKFEFGEKKN
jgi:hypothetical protein